MENYLRPIISKQKSFLFFDFKFKTSDFYSKYLNIDILISKIHPDIIFSNNYGVGMDLTNLVEILRSEASPKNKTYMLILISEAY